MTLRSYTQLTQTIDRAVVVYVSGGRKKTAAVIALAEWDRSDGGVFILGMSLDTQSESWRRLDEGARQAHAWAAEHHMIHFEGSLTTVGQMRVSA